MRATRTLLTAALVSAAVLIPAETSTVAQAAPATEPAATSSLTDGVGLDVVASGLSLAVDLAAPAGDDRLFVVEKTGRIRIVEDGVKLSTPFIDLSGPVRSSANEQGLLGLAFSPDYAEDGLFYVYYTADAGNGDTTVAEYSVSGNPNIADAGSGRILFTRDQPFTNHNGGSLQFGPDGYLYVSLGDGGGGGDPGNNGQNKNTLLGTILRIDPATGDAAPGNPFIGEPGADRIWAWGLRNPWRTSFDAVTGDMFIGDVGQGAIEEVDIIPAGVGGLNFGWDMYEGSNCYTSPCSPAGMTFPVFEYPHGNSGTRCGPSGGSITGGYVYRGNELPWLRGHYFYADWCLSELGSFRMKQGRPVNHIDWTKTLSIPGFITAFGVDGHGELYFLAQGNVYKFVSERNPDCDFNGDGYGDVAVGVPGESHSGFAAAGVVMEFVGSSGPLDPSTGTSFRQGSGGLANQPGAGDRFGEVLSCGDFNGDGYGDLAVGNEVDEGVHVLYGSAGGLRGAGSDFWTQENLGVGTTQGGEGGDRFGTALAAGDLNRDGYDDLTVGASEDCDAGNACGGSVTAVFGSGSGLSAVDAQLIHQDTLGIRDSAESGDAFGYSVAVGDIDGDGYGDVVAGVPGQDVGGKGSAGAVHVIFGRASGVGTRDVLVHRDSPGIRGGPAANARFGHSVATGVFNNDGFDDLAIGIFRSGGAVQVIYGNATGPSKRDAVYSQGKNGIPGTRESGDGFGQALATGDANGDGIDELAIGVSGEKHHGAADAGLFIVIPGSAGGLDSGSVSRWHQGLAGIKGEVAADDQFGAALRFVDTRGDGRLDLIVGSPQTEGGGEVALFPGIATGLSKNGDQLWSQDTPGVYGTTEPNDHFGGGL
ncbi:MAG: hypothetical protein GY720_04550 [bacterium]|nr:hypothetical protein [bacterium]